MTASVIAVGSPAPDFTIYTTDERPVTLSEFKGKKNVLLAFFPLAFTSTCTAELCAFGDDYSMFEGQNVHVLPISGDAVPSLKEFRSKYSMCVHLASDMKREVSRAYGVLNEATFVPRRSYFLIDKGGVVRWAHVEAKNGERRENAEILAAIASLPA
jgi:peroxiredoxin